jgi:hypothetical protein
VGNDFFGAHFLLLVSNTTFYKTIQGMSLIQRVAFQSALNAWANVAAINFVQSVDNSTTVGDLRIGFSSSHYWGAFAGDTYLPNSNPSGGDLWLNPTAQDIFLGRANLG